LGTEDIEKSSELMKEILISKNEKGELCFLAPTYSPEEL
jgi:hypothetical protein